MAGDRPVSPRLDRTARLLGLEAMDRLARAHVVVLGIGGVGTVAAEALCRAGVGRLTLVDGERIEETNANRQLHALDGAFGEPKAEALAERLRRVGPGARVDAVVERYDEGSAARLVPEGASFVVDAMDTVVAKLHVIARCLEHRIPIVTSLGAARRLDPTAIQVTDLCETHTDQLAKDVRKYLRRRFGISATAPTGVTAVWSVEAPRPTLALPGDEAGIPGTRPRLPGERRREPKCYGSAMFVTGAFGLAAAAAVVHALGGVAPVAPRTLSEAEAKRRRKPRSR
ncbi:ThiF family adenylyltransferase [Anaeromyxobacter sp. PSR-1]|uniref:tRNA threonylcarbamoyladenosine dehydratase n=1 Tax=unclassified Anaeromyxobacter TaxID=2620896 RepID=UPI0005E6979F|nr:tRNA threonylcarbamoyladenosine dehydratase [Anaeromyxobacter sp. PSR-1]GAO04666.1 tRNA threonylcarbamoyladenosine dehydratase [Anaeromyxobacter sp. PSR-1]